MDAPAVSAYQRVRRLRFAKPLRHVAPPAAAVEAYETSHSRQVSLIKDLQHLWWTREFRKLYAKLIEESSPIHDLFDPEETNVLLHFIECGGIDVICRIVADRTVHYDTSRNLHTIYRMLIRVLTEVIIVNPSFAWYLMDAHYATYQHALMLLRVRLLREVVLSLFEHTMSAVGPAIVLAKCPTFAEVINAAEGVSEIGLASRVVAMLLVPSMAVDKQEREPFPQCLSRMHRIETTIDENVRYALDHPTLMRQLVCLIEPKFYRKYQRGDDESGTTSLPQLLTAHMQWLQAAAANQVNPQPPPPPQPQPQQQPQNGGNHHEEEEEEDEDDNAGWMNSLGQDLALLVGGMQQPPILQELFEQVAAENEADQEQQPPSEITECSWFTGTGIPGDQLWRQRQMLLVESTEPISARFDRFVRNNPSVQRKSAKLVHMNIHNAQSEILFVLNTMLCTAYHRRAWSCMCQHGLLGRLRQCFPLLFAKPARPAAAAAAAAANHNNNNNADDDGNNLHGAAAAVATAHDCDSSDSDGSVDADSHTHDPPTLRKIELQRLLHEYWDAHDVDECVRNHATDPAGDRSALAELVARHLCDHEEDVCVENLMCFSLEAYIRSHWFPDRTGVQTRFEWLIPTLLRRLFPRSLAGTAAAVASRAASNRRLESGFTLLAELCKYNATSWAAVGKLLLRHRLERSLLRAITSHTFETSFFLRSLILSCYPELRSQRARRLTMAELVAMRKERLRRNPELEDHELSDAYAHATFESQEVILSRMYHVRTVSYDLYRRKVQDAGEIFDALETSPAACPMSERCRWLHVPCSCVPTAQEGPISTAGADEGGDPLTFERDPQAVSAIAELPSLWPLVQEALPVLFRNLMGHLNCEEVETSDHVCVVTTSVAVALAAYCRGGEAGVEELIRAAVGLHDAEREEVTRRHEAKKEAYMQQQQQQQSAHARPRSRRRR
jgi:hypothetical protein